MAKNNNFKIFKQKFGETRLLKIKIKICLRLKRVVAMRGHELRWRGRQPVVGRNRPESANARRRRLVVEAVAAEVRLDPLGALQTNEQPNGKIHLRK